MNYSHLVLWIGAVIITVLAILNQMRKVDARRKPAIPKHVVMTEVNNHTPQEVYDWVIYVTRTTGKGYLTQQQWDWRSKHICLLCDLRSLIHCKTEDAMLKHMHWIANVHGLNTRVLDMPL